MKENFKKLDNKEFLLTDSSLNTYSYRLLTGGYLMDEFKKNPIGYYMHGTDEYPREAGVLVRWYDLRMDGDKVFGKPMINLNHPRGERTVQEIENGFLNAASCGKIVALEISDKPTDYLPTQEGPTVSKWFNRECSLVDMPGNYNALTDLVDENNFPLDLADFKPQFKNKMEKIFLSPAHIALLPNLKANPTQDDINTAFNDLVAKANKADQLQNLVTSLTTERDALKTEVSNLKTQGADGKVKSMLDEARDKDKKITQELHDLFAVQYKGKPDDLKKVLDVMKPVGTVINLKDGKADMKQFEGKSWDQLDEAGLLPNLKAADEVAFYDLYEKQFNKKHKDDKR